MAKLREAATEHDYEIVRRIRNTCREFMTRDTREISPEEQEAWRKTLRADIKVYLFQAGVSTHGFGVVWEDGQGRRWLTGGLWPHSRGAGLGKQLFAVLCERAGLPCWLEVRADNMAALKTYWSLGFKAVDQQPPPASGCATYGPAGAGSVVTMRRDLPLFKVRMNPRAKHAAAEVIDSGYVGQGPMVELFEAELARVMGAPVLTTSSCTAALELALQLHGVGPGDRVLTSPMTCSATSTAILRRGARPVWLDVDPLTGYINEGTLENWASGHFGSRPSRSERPAALIAVDWAGRCCDRGALVRFQQKWDIPVIVDAAHSFLAQHQVIPPACDAAVCQDLGLTACWSFQAIKHLTTCDGGAILVPEPLRERARLLRWFGLDRKSSESYRCRQDIVEAGGKFHMNDLAAAIGLANLEGIEDCVEQHRSHAAYYRTLLKAHPAVDGLQLPPWDPGSSWWLYTVLCDRRDELEAFLVNEGVQASQVHRRNDQMTCFRRAAVNPDAPLPGLGSFSSRQLSLPVGWWVTAAEQERVAALVRRCLNG